MRLFCIICAVLLLVGCKGRDKTPAPTAAPEQTAAPAVLGGWDGHALAGVLVLDGEAETLSGGGYASAEPDEISVLVRGGGALTLTGSDVSKTGDTAQPLLCRAQGCNAAVNVAAGSSLAAFDSLVTTNALGAIGVHVMGESASVTLQGGMIVTSGADAPALSAVSGGAALTADAKLSAEGAGSPCVSIAGGSAVLGGGTFKSLAAPCLQLAGAGNAACTNAALTGAGGVSFVAGSGAAEQASSEQNAAMPAALAVCELTGGFLTATGEAALITASHPAARVRLSGVTAENPSGKLLSVTAGSLRVECDGQTLSGLLEAGPESVCSLVLTNGSLLTGAFLSDDPRSFSVELDASSRLSLTEDSYIGALKNADGRFTNILGNGFSLYYDASLADNAYLAGKSFALANGGYLVPMI